MSGSGSLWNPTVTAGGTAADPLLFVTGDKLEPGPGATPAFASQPPADWSGLDFPANAFAGSRAGLATAPDGSLWHFDRGAGEGAVTYFPASRAPVTENGVVPAVHPCFAGSESHGLLEEWDEGPAFVRQAGGRLLYVVGKRWRAPDDPLRQWTNWRLLIGRADTDEFGDPAWECVPFLGEGSFHLQTVPGPPALGAGGAFAVPHLQQTPADAPLWSLLLARGDVDQSGTQDEVVATFAASDVLPCGGVNHGVAAYAGERLYAGAVTAPTTFTIYSGGTAVAHDTTAPIVGLWLAGSRTGEGGLVTWATADPAASCGVTHHAAHVDFEGGAPVISDVSTLPLAGAQACSAYTGADLGPDGRAYVAAYTGGADSGTCSGPGAVTVFAQSGGPTR